MAKPWDDALITGWRRRDGRFGIRNHVVVLAADAQAGAAAARIAAEAGPAVAIQNVEALLEPDTHPAVHQRTAIGIGAHPNVAATVIVGSDEQSVEALEAGIATLGRTAVGFVLKAGQIGTHAEPIRRARDLLASAHAARAEQAPVSELWIATKCELTDATSGLASCPAVGNMFDKLMPLGIVGVFGETPELAGAGDQVANAAASPEAAAKWRAAWQAHEASLEEQRRRGTLHPQPTAGNIAGGISTVEEKALSSLEKIGNTGRFLDVLAPAARPAGAPGLYFMDTSSEVECLLLMAAAGFALHLLPTGEGIALGNPIVPVLQINANPHTLRSMGAHIDLDLSGVIHRTQSIDEGGDALIEAIIATANGRPVAAERG